MFAIALVGAIETVFDMLCMLTGGACFPSSCSNDAIGTIRSILSREFGDLELDEKLLDVYDPELTSDQIAAKLNVTVHKVLTSLGRLTSRELLI